MTKRDVFISYKSEQAEAAGWVRSVLETNGISCWMAPADIPGGSSYASEIPAAIAGCRIFVIILTEKAQQSTWMPKELDLAVNSGKIIMPFMLENCKLRNDFNFYLSNVQRYAAYENKSKAIEKMVREIQAVLGIDSAAPSVQQSQQRSGKPGKKKSVIQKLGICLAACLVISMAILLILQPWKTDPGPETALPTDQPAAQDTEASAGASAEDYYHISVYPSEQVSARNYSTAKKLLRERLDVFTDGRTYQWEDQEDMIDLMLPKASFAGRDPAYVLRCYLTRAVKLYLVNHAKSSQYLPVEREDLESVTLETGTIPGADAAAYGVTGDQYQYIVITLTDEFVNSHLNEYGTWTEPVFAQDIIEMSSNYYNYYTFPFGDGKHFYVLNTDLGGRFSELVVFNLTHKSLSEALTFSIDTNSEAVWKDPKTDPDRGANQCAAEDFSSATVTFVLQFSGDVSAGKLLDAGIGLRKRLDALDIPYAFGLIGEGESNRKITVKTPLKHMGIPVMEMLSMTLFPSLRTESLFASTTGLSLQKVSGKADTFVISSSSSIVTEEWKLLAQTALEKGEKEAYLWIGSQPLLAIQLDDEAAATGVLKVSSLCELRDGKIQSIPIDPQNIWKINLAREVIDTSYSISYCSLESYRLNAGPDGIAPTAEDFEIPQSTSSSVYQDAVRKISKNADAIYSQNSLSIEMHLPVDDSFPEQATAIPRQIVEELYAQKLSIPDYIMIYVIDEDNDQFERARVFIDKKYGKKQTEDDGSISFSDSYLYTYGIFRGGRITPYSAAIKTLIENSEFYQSIETKESSWTFK